LELKKEPLLKKDIKEIRLSNLQRLVEIGLDAKLELNIHF
jgi:hypothetical protein